MEVGTWLTLPTVDVTETTLAEVNRQLATRGFSISHEDVRMLVAGRTEALAEARRVEFGKPAIVEIAGAIATSPCLTQATIADTLAELQDAFYAIRDELPADIPDAEISEALRGCLDKWGDAATIASLPAEEVMRFSAEYARTTEAENRDEYRIVDDEGRVYTTRPSEWDYDEYADGWDGERWTDDWSD